MGKANVERGPETTEEDSPHPACPPSVWTVRADLQRVDEVPECQPGGVLRSGSRAVILVLLRALAGLDGEERGVP